MILLQLAGWAFLILGNIGAFVFSTVNILVFQILAGLGFLLLIIHTIKVIPEMKSDIRKIINTIGVLCIAGALLGNIIIGIIGKP